VVAETRRSASWPGPGSRAAYQRDGLRYAGDTVDAEWALIEPRIPPPAPSGRTRRKSLSVVVNTIFYITSSCISNGFAAGTLASLAQYGCQWRMLPDYPRHSTVLRYFYAWRDDGRWKTINHILLMVHAKPWAAGPVQPRCDRQPIRRDNRGGRSAWICGREDDQGPETPHPHRHDRPEATIESATSGSTSPASS
jgi:transposase